MNTLSILVMTMVIYLFGGYLDGAEAAPDQHRFGNLRPKGRSNNKPSE